MSLLALFDTGQIKVNEAPLFTREVRWAVGQRTSTAPEVLWVAVSTKMSAPKARERV
jgi:hypothetical protein